MRMTLNLPPKPTRCLAVLVRHPEQGKVKTRLAKAYGNPFAAELYGYFVEDLLEALSSGNYHLELFFTPAEREMEIRQRFGVRFCYSPQEGEGLGDRIEKAFRSCFAKGFTATLLIGSDCPDLTVEAIEHAFRTLEKGQDAVVGPALDGGYYLIGFRSATFDPAVFNGMPWGENTVFEKTVDLLHARGYRVHLAPAWHDIDTEKDLADLQAKHGNTTFSRSRTMAFLRNYPTPRAGYRPSPSD
ncbi:MAG: glycosyltransferase [Deltaproteobacteria bacterium]|nr:MAG: glycosyltransferase [Deltaproteobacteria bacterium]